MVYTLSTTYFTLFLYSNFSLRVYDDQVRPAGILRKRSGRGSNGEITTKYDNPDNTIADNVFA